MICTKRADLDSTINRLYRYWLHETKRSEPNYMPAIAESVCSRALTDEWYNQLREEVDYHCSLCDAVHNDIREMEQTVKNAYAFTAQSLRGVRDIGEIAKRWFGMYIFAFELVCHAQILRDTHQICGVDIELLERYRDEALDRLQLHCPELAAATANQMAG